MDVDQTAGSSDTPQFAQRRADVLSELVRLFSSGKDALGLAEAAVELVAQATGAKSVFVYFWDQATERLVLRTVTHIDLALSLHQIQMKLGEGITGWSALHRKPVLLGGDITSDPRFLKVEEVDEDSYASVLTVPIYDEETLYGVFAMYSEREGAFGEDELAIAEEVGLLLASGLKRAETVHELELQSATARFLTDMPPAANASLPSTIREAAEKILRLLDADVCLINYVAWFAMSAEPIAVAERIEGTEQVRVWLTHSKQQARETEHRYEVGGYHQISMSLGHGVTNGFITCFRSRQFSKDDVERLNAIATQVGVLIENIGIAPNTAAQTMALLASDREDQMLESLKFLGWRGNGFVPVLVQVKRVGSDIEVFGREVRDAALSVFGTETLIVNSGTLVVVLVPHDQALTAEGIQQRVESWMLGLERSIGMSADIGVGQSTARTNSIRNSLIQARGALAWASFSSTRKAPGVVSYETIQTVRELPRLVSEFGPRVSTRCEQLRPLLAYDLQHGTKLIETVEAYALHGGSAANAADALFIHRNTLRQRIGRVNDLVTENLDQDTLWPEVLFAARVLRLEASNI